MLPFLRLLRLFAAHSTQAFEGTGGESISAAKRRKRRKTEESIMEDIMKLCDVVRETGPNGTVPRLLPRVRIVALFASLAPFRGSFHLGF